MKLRAIFRPGDPKDLFQLQRMTVAITLVSVITGFLLATQLRIQQNVVKDLAAESKENLGEIIRDLDFEVRALAKEEKELELRLLKYEDSQTDNQLIIKESEANLNNLKKFVGSTKVFGEGIEINIRDAFGAIAAYDLLELVNEIKSGSSDAIAINGIRISSKTPFEDDPDLGVLIGGEPAGAPFKVEAIGDPETLMQVVGMLGGIKYTFTSYEGVTFDVIKRESVTIPRVK